MVVEWTATLSPPPYTHPWNHVPGEAGLASHAAGEANALAAA